MRPSEQMTQKDKIIDFQSYLAARQSQAEAKFASEQELEDANSAKPIFVLGYWFIFTPVLAPVFFYGSGH